MSKFHEIFGCDSVLFCRQCNKLCTSTFVYDIIFHIMRQIENEANGELLTVTRYLVSPDYTYLSPSFFLGDRL